MQNELNRLSPKSYTTAKFGDFDALKLATIAASDAAIFPLHEGLRAVDVAELALADLEPEITNAAGAALLRRFMTRNILTVRRKARREHQQRLPGYGHLPVAINTRRGAVAIMDCTMTVLREYYRTLAARERKRRESDARLTELQALMDLMRKYSGSEKKITVRQVLILERGTD